MIRIVVAALALLVLVSPALAKDPPKKKERVAWHFTFTEAVKVAKERGSSIFITMLIDDEPANVAQEDVFKEAAFVKASKDYVCVYANPYRQGKGRTAWNEVLSNYAELNTSKSGDTKVPFNFVVNAKGKVLATIVAGTVEGGFDTVPVGAFLAAFSKVNEKFGKGLTTDEYQSLSMSLKEGEREKNLGHIAKALKLLVPVVERNPNTSLAEKAKAMIDEISEGGQATLEKAMAGVATDPVASLLSLEELSKKYAGTPLAKDIKMKLVQLRQRPEIKKAVSELAAAKKAMAAMEKAEALITKKDYAKGLKALDGIAKKYPGSIGEKAKTRAAELRSDEAIATAEQEQLAAKYCKGWLSMGRSFAKNGMKDQARAKFQQVIDKFPGTSYAKQAQAELDQLK